MARETAPPDLLYPREVAAIFNVDVKTVGRWRTGGKIPADQIVATPGGSYLYRAGYIRSLLAGGAR
jgi:predicted site-specific integrase-resolvase